MVHVKACLRRMQPNSLLNQYRILGFMYQTVLAQVGGLASEQVSGWFRHLLDRGAVREGKTCRSSVV
jgi:hypothetical protein